MRFPLVICMLLLLGPMPFAFNEQNSMSKHWQVTSLNLESLYEIMNTEVCYGDRVSFFGCLTALEQIVMQKRDFSNIRLVFDTPVDSLDQIQVKRLAVERHKSMASILASHTKQHENKISYWNKLYKHKYGINFDLVLVDIINSANQNESEQELIADLINGFLSSAYSPHDHILPETMALEEDQNFIGIGVILKAINNNLFVLKTLKDSPADVAGLKGGDVIDKIQGKHVSNMKLRELNNAITELNSNMVEIEFYRDNKLHSTIIQKTLISPSNVTSKVINDEYGTWGLIKINDFMTNDTCNSAESLMYDLFAKHSNLSGFVLDLRDNQGGLVTQAICVADLFVPKDLMLLEIRPNDPLDDSIYYESRLDPIVDTPLITLVNSGSASAAEILAGTLKDHGRSILIGEQTFGKGSVMRGVNLLTNKDILYYQTFALMYFPSGATNHINGIMPDYILDNYTNRYSFRERDLFFYKYTDLNHDINYNHNSISSYRGVLGNYYSDCLTKLKHENINSLENASSYMLGCMNEPK